MCYLGTAFYAWDLNAGSWGQELRFVFLVAALFSTGAAVALMDGKING
jgi:hypothetical protein